MAFRAGTVSKFYLDSAAGSLVDLSTYGDNINDTQTVAMLETSTFGGAAKTFIAGLQDGDQFTVAGPYDVAVWMHFVGLKEAQKAGTASHSFIWGPGGSVAGQAREAGECLVAAFSGPNSGVGGRVEYTLTLQKTGAVTLGSF